MRRTHVKGSFNTLKSIVAISMTMVSVGSTFASTFDGQVSEVAIGQTSTGTIRVSVRVTDYHNSPCTGAGLWFAYEYPDSGVGKVWTAAFIAAKESGGIVHINGTGMCDQFGVEGVYSMHLL